GSPAAPAQMNSLASVTIIDESVLANPAACTDGSLKWESMMRCFFSLFLTLSAAMNSLADTFVYVSLAPEQKIQIYRLDPQDGKLTPIETVAVDGAPGCLSVDPQQKFLYASLRSNSTLASFSIDPKTGMLKLQSTAALPKDENAAFVRTDRTGKWLI